MKNDPIMKFYRKIMDASNEGEVYMINLEIQEAVLDQTVIDNKDIMLLNLALQVKSNYFLMKEVMESGGGTTIMVVGNPEDFDPEQMQLDEFKEQEFEDFKEGNVVSIKDFGKKKD